MRAATANNNNFFQTRSQQSDKLSALKAFASD